MFRFAIIGSFFLFCLNVLAIAQEGDNDTFVLPIVKSMFPTVTIVVPGNSPKLCTVTTSAQTFISSSWYNELSQKQQNNGFVTANIFGRNIVCDKKYTGPFSDTPTSRFPKNFSGYIGTDYWEHCDFTFDPDLQVVKLGDLDQANTKGCEIIPVEYNVDQITSEAATPKIFLDFGDNVSCDAEVQISQKDSLTLSTTLFDELLSQNLITLDRQKKPGEESSALESRIGRVRMVKIGQFVLSNVICKEGSRNQVGAYLLHRFFIGLSLKDKILALRLQKKCDWDHADNDGIFFKVKLTQLKSVLLVKAVSEGSIAAEAGVLPGDELVQVGDVPGSQYFVAAARLIIRDKPIAVDIFRNGKQIKIMLPNIPEHLSNTKKK